MAQSDPYLKTLDRALEMLLLFAKEKPEWSASDMAQALGLHRSIVYRMLKTLEQRGFLAKTERYGHFTLGLKMVELGNIALGAIDLRQIADPYMIQLAKETSETTILSIENDGDCVCIAKIESSTPIRTVLSIGERSPLYAGAAAKSLLAYLDAEKTDRILARGLNPVTPRTITDPTRLLEDLEKIRRQGWAYSVGELAPDLAAVAAPLRDGNGVVVATLTTTGLAFRFNAKSLPMLIDATCRAAKDITDQLDVWQKKR